MAETTEPTAAHAELRDLLLPLGRMGQIAGLLGWDQQVMMPAAGAEARAEQRALLSGMLHERLTDPELAARLRAVEASEPPAGRDAAALARLTRREVDHATKVPAPLVRELTLATSRAREAWVRARRDDDFGAFAPHLTTVFELRRRQADALGWEDHPYDALHDLFEPGSSTRRLERLFGPLRERLVRLLERIRNAPRDLDDAPLRRDFDPAVQERFARETVADLGFDFDAGRLDVAVHPFAAGLAPGDVRITTRYDRNFLSMALFGAMHEAGHGMYEQGLPPADAATPLGTAVSLGVHESQSRLWENLVGRSRAFWEGRYARLREAFPEALHDVSLDAFVAAINRVQPSLIRVEADEVTYNLHVLLRFELEKALLVGDLKAEDLPAAWSEKMQAYLGITPPDDARGCLQDIHWSIGHVGYFPTYTLGNLMSVPIWNAARAALPSLDDDVRAGRFAPLLGWLRDNVHARGSRLEPDALLREVTGAELDAEPYLRYLEDKYGALYGFTAD